MRPWKLSFSTAWFLLTLFNASLSLARPPDLIDAVEEGLKSATIGLPCATCAIDNWRQRAKEQFLKLKKEAEDWNKAGFKHAEITTLTSADLYTLDTQETPALDRSKRFTHELTITAVVFRNSNWSAAEMKARFSKVAGIYQKCGIKIKKVKIVEADAPNGWIDLKIKADKKSDSQDSLIAKLAPTTSRPLFFYVRSDSNGDWANSFLHAPDYPGELYDTIRVMSDVKKYEGNTEDDYDPSINLDAHELAHILNNSGHDTSGTGNILSGDAKMLTGDITPAQCENMKKSPLVRPI